MENIAPNQPLYLYQTPMFMVTVSTVLIVENGVILIEGDKEYKFPHGIVRAGQESVQFAAVRHVKEQTGIRLTKESLMPVDYRSDPCRSEEGNILDIDFMAILGIDADSLILNKGNKWMEVDFEEKVLCKNDIEAFMDHEILLERALEIAYMIKE